MAGESRTAISRTVSYLAATGGLAAQQQAIEYEPYLFMRSNADEERGAMSFSWEGGEDRSNVFLVANLIFLTTNFRGASDLPKNMCPPPSAANQHVTLA